MLECIILWIYMTLICLLAGIAALSLGARVLHTPAPAAIGVTPCIIAGITVLTVYAEFFSIFHGVKAGAHILMLALICLLYLSGRSIRQDAKQVFALLRPVLCSKEWLIILLITAVIAFFSSRGDFHADTKIYHAQAIRLIEEYGCIRGLGNIQLHFAYNSSALVFAALFSMSFLPGAPAHGTTGFLMLVLSLYSIHGIINARRTRQVRRAAVQAGILLYVFTNLYYAMSPATDYFAQLFVLFILAEWSRSDLSSADDAGAALPATGCTGLLSVLAAFTLSLKLSAGAIVVLAIYPLVRLIRARRPRLIVRYLLAGFVMVLPFLVRNVILSGWLVYPVAAIDLFQVDWKIPKEYLLHDAAQIEVWGKCLYDVSKQNDTLRQWFPIWYEGQQHYELMLFYAQFVAVLELLLLFIRRRCAHRKPDWRRAVFYMGICISLAFWFFTAPFIRYGLACLLALPLCASCDLMLDIRQTAGTRRRTFSSTAGVLLVLAVLFCGTSWIDNYGTDNLRFLKNQLRAPYYVFQKPYDQPAEETVDMGNGVTIYSSTGEEESNSYWVTPSTCYQYMAERSMARGDRIEDGFRARSGEGS